MHLTKYNRYLFVLILFNAEEEEEIEMLLENYLQRLGASKNEKTKNNFGFCSNLFLNYHFESQSHCLIAFVDVNRVMVRLKGFLILLRKWKILLLSI